MKVMYNIKNNIFFLKYLFDFSKIYVCSQGILSLISGFAPLISIIIPKLIIDELTIGQNFKKIIVYVITYVIIQLSLNLIRAYINDKYINLNGHLYAMHFLLLINKKITSLDMIQLDDPKIHQKIALAQDIIYKGIGVSLINGFFGTISGIIIIFSTSVLIAAADKILLIVIVLTSIITVLLNLKIENWRISQRDENIYLTRVLNYYIKIMGEKCNNKEMKISGLTQWLMDKYKETLKQLKIRLNKLYTKSFKINSIVIIVENIKNNGIYLYLAYLTFIKKITLGGFTQYFAATGQLSNAILNLATFITQLNINGKYIESFKEFMETESILEKEQLIKKTTEECICKDKIKLKLENLSFSYTNSTKNVLENLNYEFEQGKIYMIVGENGVGKSTLVNIICRLYAPTEGEIYLNNEAVININLNQYRDLFSVVFQDFKYFAFTIAENVAINNYKNDAKTYDKVKDSLELAGLWKKINSLPLKMDTNLDKIFYDDGVILSGGENQKLSLARTIFRNSNIIILDEPSSALDPIAEDELLKSFKEVFKDKLVIYISHRMTCALDVDEVIFLKNGVIKESGKHKDLIKLDQEYAKYYNMQAKKYNQNIN